MITWDGYLGWLLGMTTQCQRNTCHAMSASNICGPSSSSLESDQLSLSVVCPIHLYLLELQFSLAMSLFSLFVEYPVRKRLLQALSAYDIAKLDVVFGGFLPHPERQLYLNPIRDLIENTDEVQDLEAYGMKLLLFGNDVLALRQRLQHPQDYIRKHGHSRRLQVYLVGLCPVFTKTTGIRDRLLSFSLSGARDADGTSEDTIQMRLLKAEAVYGDLSPRTEFIMSLGAPYRPSKQRGFWLHVQAVPDPTVDLRLYVPSFLDRQRREVLFPHREACHLSMCILRKAWLLSCLADVLRMCFGLHVLSVANLTSRGLYIVGPHGRIWSQKRIDIQTVDLADIHIGRDV
jgi:hypothetical protein